MEEARQVIAGGTVQVLVVEPYDADGTPCAPFISELRRRGSRILVFAYTIPRQTASQDIAALFHAGANQLLQEGMDDARWPLRAALQAGRDAGVIDDVIGAIRAVAPDTLRPLLETCVRHPEHTSSVSDAARMIGIHRRTLHDRLVAAGHPAPFRLRNWCRVLLAVRLLEDSTRTVVSVALRVALPSEAALRHLLKRYASLTPRDIRTGGEFDRVVRMFAEVVQVSSTTSGRRPSTRTAAARRTPDDIDEPHAALRRVAEPECETSAPLATPLRARLPCPDPPLGARHHARTSC